MQPDEGFERVIKGKFFRSGGAKIKDSCENFFKRKHLSSTESAVSVAPVCSGAARRDLSSGR